MSLHGLARIVPTAMGAESAKIGLRFALLVFMAGVEGRIGGSGGAREGGRSRVI
ncbi:MAG: hypothetical protein O8C64_02935 [Candidatus Methanoperedens sp.]|nr:hypothetical protein [Candidatus Methanoperedens sp.]MCZ7406513.1 hypothetical protein [Candidatus Methanoperedens sp.]